MTRRQLVNKVINKNNDNQSLYFNNFDEFEKGYLCDNFEQCCEIVKEKFVGVDKDSSIWQFVDFEEIIDNEWTLIYLDQYDMDDELVEFQGLEKDDASMKM